MVNSEKKFRPVYFYVPIFLWAILHMYLAYERSIWMDEFYRYRQFQMPFLASLKHLFGEPSPFAPGEMILGWISKILFSGFTPFEFWSRLPNVGWGALTLFLIARRNDFSSFVFVFFSVALTTFSTQTRPYASLVAGGALAFYLLWDRKHKETSVDRVVFWLVLLFSHIYVICFLGLVAALKRQWTRLIVAVAFLGVILLVHHFAPRNEQPYWSLYFPSFLDFVKQIFGTLSNPHKAAYVLLPFFLLGCLRLFQERRSVFFEVMLFFSASLLGPIVATYFAKYFFMPRQISGATVGFVVLSAFGLQTLLQRRALTAIVFLFCGVVPWVLTIVLGRPPFVDQPQHRYRQVAEKIVFEKHNHTLLVDAAGFVPFYLTRILGSEPLDAVKMQGTLRVHQLTWANGPTVFLVDDASLLYAGAEQFLKNPNLEGLLKQNSISLIVSGYDGWPEQFNHAPIVRTW